MEIDYSESLTRLVAYWLLLIVLQINTYFSSNLGLMVNLDSHKHWDKWAAQCNYISPKEIFHSDL